MEEKKVDVVEEVKEEISLNEKLLEEIEDKVQEFKREGEVIVGIYASDTLGHDYMANAR